LNFWLGIWSFCSTKGTLWTSCYADS